MSISLRSPVPALLLIALLTLLAYWPGLSGSFLFDDFPNILQNERIQITSLDLESLRSAANSFSGARPLAMLSLAVDHYLWGIDPWGYKLTNLTSHLANSLLVYVLVLALLRAPRSGTTGTDSLLALFLALAWAIHPLQVSTTLYVIQRMEMMSFTFVLLALLAYLKGRRLQAKGMTGWPWLVACALLGAAGLLFKESAVLLPAYTLALELTVLGFAAAKPGSGRRWRLAYGAATLAALAVFILLVIPRYVTEDAYAFRDFTAGERLLTQLRALPMYLGWILAPNPAAYVFYYDNYPVSTSLLQPISTLLGAALLAALAGTAWMTRKRIPLLSLGILWFFASHFLTSNVAALELVFEHRNYAALLGVLLAVAAVIQRIPAITGSRILPLASSVILVGLLAMTLIRSASWGDPINLAIELANRNPTSSRASADLGEQYMMLADGNAASPFYAMAVQEFERGASIPGSSPMPEQGLILLAAIAGQQAKQEWWDSLVSKLETRAVGPQEVSMLTGLMARRDDGLEFDDKRFADAYMTAVNRIEMPPTQYFAFGLHALNHLKDPGLAQALFRMSAEHASGDPTLVAALVEALANRGHRQQAEQLADFTREALKIEVALPPRQAPEARSATDETQGEPSK